MWPLYSSMRTYDDSMIRAAAIPDAGAQLIPQCRRAHGPDDDLRLLLRQNYAEALYSDAGASRADVLQAVAILEDVTRASRQTFGAHHPRTLDTLTHLEGARMRHEDVS